MPASGIVLLDGVCEAYVVQNEEAQLYRAYSTKEADLQFDIEINNLGYHPDEKVLYGLELTPIGNNGIVSIDSFGFVTFKGWPDFLPLDVRFDAGDVSTDGTKMYVNHAGLSPIFTVDLESMTTTAKDITGGVGFVHDWAAHPNGSLYGGDSSHGQLAVLNPATGVRKDYTVEGLSGGLPQGVAYGAAWFDPNGRLALNRNDGLIVMIELGDDPLDPQPKKLAELTRRASSRNDGASCVPQEFLETNLFNIGLPCVDLPGTNCKDSCEPVGVFACTSDGGSCYCFLIL